MRERAEKAAEIFRRIHLCPGPVRVEVREVVYHSERGPEGFEVFASTSPTPGAFHACFQVGPKTVESPEWIAAILDESLCRFVRNVRAGLPV